MDVHNRTCNLCNEGVRDVGINEEITIYEVDEVISRLEYGEAPRYS